MGRTMKKDMYELIFETLNKTRKQKKFRNFGISFFGKSASMSFSKYTKKWNVYYKIDVNCLEHWIERTDWKDGKGSYYKIKVKEADLHELINEILLLDFDKKEILSKFKDYDIFTKTTE